jgi:hypothetical protein
VAEGTYRDSMTVRRTGVRPVGHTGSSDQDKSLSAPDFYIERLEGDAIAAVSALVRRKTPPGNQPGGVAAQRCWS